MGDTMAFSFLELCLLFGGGMLSTVAIIVVGLFQIKKADAIYAQVRRNAESIKEIKKDHATLREEVVSLSHSSGEDRTP